MADPYSPGKTSRFLGICIQKCHAGLWHKFTLRNVIDEQGIIFVDVCVFKQSFSSSLNSKYGFETHLRDVFQVFAY